MTEEYLTINEVAARLKIKPKTVKNVKNEIPTHRLYNPVDWGKRSKLLTVFSPCARTVCWKVSDGPTGNVFATGKIEGAFIAQIQSYAAVKSQIQKHAANGSLEPLLGAEQVAQILGVDVGHVHT